MNKRKAQIVRQIAELVIELLEMCDKRQQVVQVVEAPPPKPGFQPMVYSMNDAAKHLGVSRATLYRMISDKEIKSFTFGKSRRIERAELERYIAVRRATK